jgi:hypothetical protein
LFSNIERREIDGGRMGWRRDVSELWENQSKCKVKCGLRWCGDRRYITQSGAVRRMRAALCGAMGDNEVRVEMGWKMENAVVLVPGEAVSGEV